MISPLLEHAKRWIEASWREVGSGFQTSQVPVVQFEQMDVDDLAHPFKNIGQAFWLLNAGTLCEAGEVSIQRVPYVAFSLVPDESRMNVQVHWAPRCGYGFQVHFDAAGELVQQHMRWVS
ncbi:hypothetical protein [Rhizobacter sp. Root1221]|uniref:hypothetical protein n=1 Tax=Rhizobacter sp. Root1221 TaxID=1736433 RepID=UPI0006F3FB87|nr:hypothetical protein [Rhizobacter sp. Root1221]KQV83327.1 hypothetical protein ASC87_30195 [Rhizobacter sp. Root1221]